jgi:hypothetical protein
MTMNSRQIVRGLVEGILKEGPYTPTQARVSNPKFIPGDKVKVKKSHYEFGDITGTIRSSHGQWHNVEHDKKDADGTSYTTKHHEDDLDRK